MLYSKMELKTLTIISLSLYSLIVIFSSYYISTISVHSYNVILGQNIQSSMKDRMTPKQLVNFSYCMFGICASFMLIYSICITHLYHHEDIKIYLAWYCMLVISITLIVNILHLPGPWLVRSILAATSFDCIQVSYNQLKMLIN